MRAVTETSVLEQAAAHAVRYIEALDGRPICATASPGELRERLGKPLPEDGLPAEQVINQGLVRFLARDGDHDRATDRVIARIQKDGTAFFGGVTWRGQRVMRVSVCNWATGEGDIARSIEAVRDALGSEP